MSRFFSISTILFILGALIVVPGQTAQIVGCTPPAFCGDFTTTAVSPLKIALTATTTGGSSPFSFAWGFGDGGTGSGNPVTHPYSSPNTYLVTLTITDSSGTTFSIDHDITVIYPPGKPFITGTQASWNPNVLCLASKTTVPGVVGNITNGNGGADLSGAGSMSLVLKHTTQRPCTVLGFSVFVEIHNVAITFGPLTTTDCFLVNGVTSCDIVGNFDDFNQPCAACLPGTIYMQEMRWELERQWTADGLVSSNFPQTGQRLDLQGFLYWSFLAPADAAHDFSGWYLELTAWRPALGPATACNAADFNVDGRVNILDVAVFALHYKAVTGDSLYDPRFDLDHDGTINILDLAKLAVVYGQTC